MPSVFDSIAQFPNSFGRIYVSPMESIEHTFGASSDRTRLRVLRLLSSEELLVGDPADLRWISQTSASRYLANLRRNGLVDARRDGQGTFCCLAIQTSGIERKLMSCSKASRDENPALVKDARRATELSESGGCCIERENDSFKTRGRALPENALR